MIEPAPDPSSPYVLPPDLPVPIDDGAAAHLRGAKVPPIVLQSTSGEGVDLRTISAAGSGAVLFFYPRTGIPGQPLELGFSGEHWDSIPGARGCTPQSCGFRDLYQQFKHLDAGVEVFGVSTQNTAFQCEFRERNHIPFHFLSDAELQLTEAMRLPTMHFPVESGGPDMLIRRMVWYIRDGRIRRVWYPVFPPDRCAEFVLKDLIVGEGMSVMMRRS